jgi:hypothetical protein
MHNTKLAIWLLILTSIVIGFIGGCSTHKLLNKENTAIQIDTIYTPGIEIKDTLYVTKLDTIVKTRYVPKYVTKTIPSKRNFLLTYLDTIKGKNYSIVDSIIVTDTGKLLSRNTKVDVTNTIVTVTKTDTLRINTITQSKIKPKLLIGSLASMNNLKSSIDVTAALQLKNATLLVSKPIHNNEIKIGVLLNPFKIFKGNKSNSKRTKKDKGNNKKLLSFLFKNKLSKTLSD